MPSTPTPRGPRPPWYQRRGPSVLVLAVLLLVVGLVTAALADDVADVLPQIGKDEQGEEPWSDPVAVEKAGPYRIIHVPDCALAPIDKVVLWDEDSKPYWEVQGPAASLSTFVIGATPPGFDVVVPFEEPPPGVILRIGVFRTTGSAAGTRYRESDLRTGYAAGGDPVVRYKRESFTKGDVCGEDGGEDPAGGATTSSSMPTSDPLVTTTTISG